MSQISRDDVAHLARLARLSLTGAELDGFAGQLDAILAHVGRIQSVDVSGVAATDSPLSAIRSDGLADTTRADAVAPGLTQEQALAGAPRAADGRFAVPRILGDSE